MTKRSTLLLCAAALGMPATGWAQTAAVTQTASAPPAGELGDIVVTARKRAESLQDVPVAVVALTPAQLQNNVTTDLTKVAELTPQVVIGRSIGGTGALITIRGISSSPSDSGLDQSVAVEIDGVPLSRGRVIAAQLFDMAQVTILQGPQALFFGKNSPAGVVSMASADPTQDFAGFVRGGYEFTANERFVEAALSGPVAENLKVRLAGRYDKMDGWIKNVAQAIANPFQPAFPLPGVPAGTKSPNTRDIAGRLTVLWTPGSDFTAKFKALLSKQDTSGNGAFSEPFCINGVTVPTQNGTVMPFADCNKDRRKAETNLPPALAVNYPYGNGGVPYAFSRFGLYSLNLTKEWDGVSLASTTGYYTQLIGGSHNADFSPFIQIYSAERERYRIITQELRLNTDFDGPINGTIGGYLEHADRHWLNAPDLFHVFNTVLGNYVTNIQTSNSDNDSYSAFAQVRWKIVPELELAGGARYTKDVKKSTFINQNNNLASGTGRALFPQGVPLTSTYVGDNVSPDVTLTWKPSRDHMLYVAYKTGYKAGGISNSSLLQANATPATVRFGAEKTRGFEGGYKATLLDRRLRLDLTAYRYRYEGLQLTSLDSINFRYRVNNAASARTQGVVGTAQWLVADGLTLDGSLGYNKAVYLDYRTAPCATGQTAAQGCVGGVQNLSGRHLNRAPKLTTNIGGNYEAKFGNGWGANFSASAAYTSSYQTHTDYAAGGFQESFWRVNAAARIKTPGDKFEIALVGRNLTNAYYLITTSTWPGVGNPNEFIGVFNRPREVVLEATARF